MSKTVIRMICALAVALLSGANANAASADEFWSKTGMPELKTELTELGLANLANVSDGTVWSADASILGMPSVKLYLYWVGGSRTPVLAIPLPIDLSTGTLTQYVFGGQEAIDLGLKTPVLFWVPKDITELKRTEMPKQVQERATVAGLPTVVQMAQGLNLFGRVSGGFLSELTKLKLPNPSNLTVGLARRTDGTQTSATVSVALAADAVWSTPFGLANTAISGVTLRVTTASDKLTKIRSKTTETWGTARIKNKDYTAYLQSDDLGLQSLAFDTRVATLENFFDIFQVVGRTLGLPNIPSTHLPLNQVSLQNDRYQPPSVGNLPDFATMMFRGTKGTSPELNLNATARVFGWNMAEGYVKADQSGINGDVKLAGGRKIGPLAVPSAKFLLTLNSSKQDMHIETGENAIYGKLVLTAMIKNNLPLLELDVPPNCPLRPVGFTANVSDLTHDFPIHPKFSDCYSAELKKLVEGVEEAYKETEQFAGEMAGDTAATAEELGTDAVDSARSLHLEKAAAWPGTLVAYVGDVKAAKDVARAAATAVSAAEGTVSKLANDVSDLEKKISKLAGQIKDLLDDIWGAITGEVKDKRKEKAHAISKRDHARAQKAAAQARLNAAEKNQKNANHAISKIPGPSISGNVAELQEALLGAQAQAVVQPQVAAMLRALPDQLKDAKTRKDVLGAIDPATVINAKQLSFDSNPPNLSDLYKDGVDRGLDWVIDAKKSLVALAIEAKTNATTEALLQETVPGLPTMAYGKEVQIVLASTADGSALCVERDESIQKHRCASSLSRLPAYCATIRESVRLTNCDPTAQRQKFTFQADGAVFQKPGSYAPDRCGYLNADKAILSADTMACPGDPNYSPPQSFFFDPDDGLIRYVSQNDSTPLCLHADTTRIIEGDACPPSDQAATSARWVLVDPTAKPVLPTAKAKLLIAPRWASPGRVVPHALTNLEPLKLE